MAEHTPGPWVSGRTYDNGEPAEMVVRAGCEIIAAITKTIDEDQDEANARLMSAAPDLLKALENIVGDVDLRDEFEDAARAAIAKARGTA